MGAMAGENWLRRHNLPVVGLSGVLTASPLQRQEASAATGLPLFSREDLAQAGNAMQILGHAGAHSVVEFEARAGHSSG